MRIIPILLFLAFELRASGQGQEVTLNTDSGTVVIHYFTSGKVSTRQWTDLPGHWGRSWAYKQDGTVIVEHQTRRIAGHASVRFRYHPNGAISDAEYSDAPDAGIQWYRSTTAFDPQGNRTGFVEQGHDNDGLIPRVPVQPAVAPMEQEAIEEQRMFVNELFVVNPTRWTCSVHVLVDNPSPGLHARVATIGPKDTLRVGSYSIGERFAQPEGHVRVFVSRRKGNGQWYKMASYRLVEENVSSEHRRYYRVVKGWTSTKRIW